MRKKYTDRAAFAALALAALAVLGCGKKDNYAADTATAVSPADTATASSTSNMAPDTANKTTAAAPAAKKTTAKKKAPTKPTY